MNPFELQKTEINGREIIARRFYLEALWKAHEELIREGIGVQGKTGFVLGGVKTSSWRTLAMQQLLKAQGLSKTLWSNHRRGVAVDCYPDLEYVNQIQPIMAKHGLVNDLGAWDRVHFNWQSNKHSWTYDFIDELPLTIKDFSMHELENHFIQEVEKSGSFALVLNGKKQIVGKTRLAEALATVFMRGMQSTPVNKSTWDDIPTGKKF